MKGTFLQRVMSFQSLYSYPETKTRTTKNMVEHYRSDFNITDIVHIKKKCYKYASGTVRVIDIFAICKIFQNLFFLVCIMKKTTKIEMKDVLKF